jgi:translation elongation factor P/translation initiation factor 5A
MLLTSLDLRKGLLVLYQGRMCTVSYWNILRNDRRQFVQMNLRDLQTGRVTELKEHTDSKFEVLETSQIGLTHSYRDGPEEVFYTADGVEYRCPAEAAAEALRWTVDEYQGFLADGKLVSVSTPTSVTGKVVETAPPIRGAGSGMKDALLENGVKVKVSQLTQVGDRVRLDAETLEFRERLT